jgi:hypothetical protein
VLPFLQNGPFVAGKQHDNERLKFSFAAYQNYTVTMKCHQLRIAAALSCCIGILSCASYQRSDLYFGRDIPGGGQVSEQAWKAFSDSVISAYFPEGYTEWDAKGRWKDTETKETISEPTKVVTFFGKMSKERSAAIDSIAQRYLRRFRQQSVLRTDSKAKVTFINKTP